MVRYGFLLPVFFLLLSCDKSDNTGNTPQTLRLRAADLSFLPQVRQSGITIKNQAGAPEDMLFTLKNAGANTVRLRLWVDPAGGHSGLGEVKQLAQEVKNAGMSVWLCLHYSDSWADPGKQTKPARWQGAAFEALKDSVYQYTKAVTAAIQPDYIQIGNEINDGLLWPDGKAANRDQFRALLSEGIRAVREQSAAAKIMLHYAGHDNAEVFFNNLSGLDYDIMALSYYPIWHGKFLNSLDYKIRQLGDSFQKDVVIAETAYPFTFGWSDWTTNIIGSADQILAEYPASPQGQLDFLNKIRDMLQNSPRGLGFCYWGGEWVAFNGSTATDGSSWENQALWDFDYRALPALSAFHE